MHPGAINFERLAAMYGTVGSRRLGSPLIGRRILPEDWTNEFGEAEAKTQQFSLRRSLRDGDGDGDGDDAGAPSQWVLEEFHERSSRYSLRLGDELSLEVHLLHATPLVN